MPKPQAFAARPFSRAATNGSERAVDELRIVEVWVVAE
jgi:hypothetical protein